jgi:anthranilate phosphoribosyltransferase
VCGLTSKPREAIERAAAAIDSGAAARVLEALAAPRMEPA